MKSIYCSLILLLWYDQKIRIKCESQRNMSTGIQKHVIIFPAPTIVRVKGKLQSKAINDDLITNFIL